MALTEEAVRLSKAVTVLLKVALSMLYEEIGLSEVAIGFLEEALRFPEKPLGHEISTLYQTK